MFFSGIKCPPLPDQPSGQPADIPWDGNVVLEQQPFFFLGSSCLGQNLLPDEYHTPKSCPQLKLRMHQFVSLKWLRPEYTCTSGMIRSIRYREDPQHLIVSSVQVDFVLSGPAGNDSFWLNISTSEPLLHVLLQEGNVIRYWSVGEK